MFLFTSLCFNNTISRSLLQGGKFGLMLVVIFVWLFEKFYFVWFYYYGML